MPISRERHRYLRLNTTLLEKIQVIQYKSLALVKSGISLIRNQSLAAPTRTISNEERDIGFGCSGKAKKMSIEDFDMIEEGSIQPETVDENLHDYKNKSRACHRTLF